MGKSDTGSKMGQRALQGAALGPWGALGGAFVGGMEQMFGGGGSNANEVRALQPNNPLLPGGGDGSGIGSGPPTMGPGSPGYTPGGNIDKSAFQAPTAGKYFGPQSGQPGSWWLEQAGVLGGNKGYVGDDRYNRNQARQTQMDGLQMLGQYARGDKSAARLAANAQQDRTMAAIQSRMASTPGGYNPSVQARGIDAVSGAGQQMAGTTAAAAAAEQLAAQKAYLQATGQMRGQDISGQLAEQQWYSQQAAAKMAYQNMKAKYLALGLDEKNADRAAAMEYEKLKSGNANVASGQALTAQQIANQQGQYDTNRADNYIMGGLKAGSSWLTQQGTGSSGGDGSGSGSDSGSGGMPDNYWDW